MDSRRSMDRTYSAPSSAPMEPYFQNQIVQYRPQNQIAPYSKPRIDPYANNSYVYSTPPVMPAKSKSTSSWNIQDPEFQRRRRVASYKAYSVEGKVKSSIRRSFQWFKNKFYELRYEWW